MSTPFQTTSTLLLALLLASACLAQHETDIVTRPPRPLTRRELAKREALELFAQASDQEHRNRLPESLRTFEKALRLDPDSAAIRRALVPLYLALDRQKEALEACERIVELDPDDFETWHSYARQLRGLDKDSQARKALLKAADCKGLKEHPESHLAVVHDLGTVHEKLKDFAGAEAAFREVIDILERPSASQEQGGVAKEDLMAQVADTYERVGRLCLRVNRTDRAVEAFRQAQTRDPARAARLSYNLAEVLAAQKRDDDALKYLDQYLARQPQGVEGYELKLKLLRRMGREKEVVAALEKHSKDDAYHNALKLLLAKEYQKVKRLEDAEKTYQSLLTTPQVDVYRGLFGLYRLEGKSGAVKLLDRLNSAIEAANPDDKNQPPNAGQAGQAAHARAMLGALREERDLIGAILPLAVERVPKGPLAYKTRIFLGVLAERTGELEKAEKLYRSCLDEKGRIKEFGERRQSETEVYGGLLKVLMLARKYDDVVRVCKQGLEHAEATNRVMFYLEEAHALTTLGRTDEALEASRTAVKMSADRDRLICRRSHASLLASAGKFKEAVAECESLLKDFKDEEDVRTVRFALSSIYTLAKENEKAEEQLKVILEADPLDAHANNDLGYLWADRNKNLEEAEKMIRKALELDEQQRKSRDALGFDAGKDNAAYVDSLGWVLFRRGRLKEAREQLEKAASLPDGGRDPVIWDHLGDVYARQKETGLAVEAWKKALKLYEEKARPRSDERHKEIRQKLERFVQSRP
jgi:tetratricopeptide (TPR) repeat protein